MNTSARTIVPSPRTKPRARCDSEINSRGKLCLVFRVARRQTHNRAFAAGRIERYELCRDAKPVFGKPGCSCSQGIAVLAEVAAGSEGFRARRESPLVAFPTQKRKSGVEIRGAVESGNRRDGRITRYALGQHRELAEFLRDACIPEIRA